jgi:hypothetical protein
MQMRVGRPVDLDDLRGREVDAQVLYEATDRILDAITALLAGIRGEQPPAVRHDPRAPGDDATPTHHLERGDDEAKGA